MFSASRWASRVSTGGGSPTSGSSAFSLRSRLGGSVCCRRADRTTAGSVGWRLERRAAVAAAFTGWISSNWTFTLPRCRRLPPRFWRENVDYKISALDNEHPPKPNFSVLRSRAYFGRFPHRAKQINGAEFVSNPASSVKSYIRHPSAVGLPS